MKTTSLHSICKAKIACVCVCHPQTHAKKTRVALVPIQVTLQGSVARCWAPYLIKTTHTHMHTQTHTHSHTHSHIHKCTQPYTHTHTLTHTCTQTHTHTCTHTHMHTHTLTHNHTCTHIATHTTTHTTIHSDDNSFLITTDHCATSLPDGQNTSSLFWREDIQVSVSEIGNPDRDPKSASRGLRTKLGQTDHSQYGGGSLSFHSLPL